MRERSASNSSKASESLPPDNPISILSPSSISPYWQMPFIRRVRTRFKSLISSVFFFICSNQKKSVAWRSVPLQKMTRYLN